MPRTSLKSAILTAIEAHAAWRRRLEQAIESETWRDARSFRTCEFALERIRDYEDCPLGRWLHGNGLLLETPAALARVRSAQMLHIQFHEAAAGILELALAGLREAAHETLDPNERYAKVSSEMTAILQTLANEVT